jgi:hypothetical protein
MTCSHIQDRKKLTICNKKEIFHQLNDGISPLTYVNSYTMNYIIQSLLYAYLIFFKT